MCVCTKSLDVTLTCLIYREELVMSGIARLIALPLTVGVVWVFVLGVAGVSKESGERRHIKLASSNPDLPFSDGVLVGKTLYLAGRIGIDSDTGKPPSSVEKEVRIILDGIKATLKAADMTMNDLVAVEVYCPDMSLYGQFNDVYRTYFDGDDFPARAFLGSGPLILGGRFEVKGIAVKD